MNRWRLEFEMLIEISLKSKGIWCIMKRLLPSSRRCAWALSLLEGFERHPEEHLS